MHTSTLGRFRSAWKAGELHPYTITLALDLRGLYGPQVDRDLGVPEPTVDEWEAGVRYPTMEQWLRLAVLCGVPLSFFLAERPPAPTGPTFLCSRSSPSKSMVIHPGPRVESFTDEAIARTLNCQGTDNLGPGNPNTLW